MSPAERAKAAYAAAELADHPRDKAALKAAAAAWERISRSSVPWSHEPLRRDLRQLKRDVVAATGPFTAPKAPKAAPTPEPVVESALTQVPEVSSIQF